MRISKTEAAADQARKRFFDALRARGGADWAEFDSSGSSDIEMAAWEVDRAVGQLDALIAKGEEVDRVPVLARLIAGHAQKAVKLVAGLRKLMGVIDDLARDPEFLEHVSDAIDSLSSNLGKSIERGGNAAQKARAALARAEQYLARQKKGGDAAEEAWSTALLDFERVCDAAEAESKRWGVWAAAAHAAHKARDAAALDTLRKAMPPAAALATVAGWPRDRPFAAFDAEFKLAELPAALRADIQRDRTKAMGRYARVQLLPAARTLAQRQVQSLRVEPADGRKGLTVLGLPKQMLPKLQAAIDAPPAQRVKALDALARSLKLSLDGRQMVSRLEKAGVF